jgi:hypothetical protein
VDYIFNLEGIGPAARITMTFQTGFYDNPLQRYLGLMMDRFVKDELEISLLRLKTAAENRWKELQEERS